MTAVVGQTVTVLAGSDRGPTSITGTVVSVSGHRLELAIPGAIFGAIIDTRFATIIETGRNPA